MTTQNDKPLRADRGTLIIGATIVWLMGSLLYAGHLLDSAYQSAKYQQTVCNAIGALDGARCAMPHVNWGPGIAWLILSVFGGLVGAGWYQRGTHSE